ncbi:MAG: NADH-quinone oxidoreductase subunit L [Candidatus Fischerbacteria bacterium RBG_13_37_8]|uniref:NADH-quinone oxidoreductase subunit L n=1 Tax=Candidatus Fischerbacteria bacterium RBG_13_37_8 TaxID=1817863 RepID=A0A1F5V8V5_9BACT|nr:MAG: NADH-quinone oxidoreductase subunit L [Candidatus Fischerbacteria bacterium RBG_13_37_8]
MWGLAGLIIIFPLLGLLINLFIGNRLSRKWIGVIACGSVALSCLATIVFAVLFHFNYPAEGSIEANWYQWIVSGSFVVDFGFRIDWLSLVMALTVSFVGFLIHVYSVGYMWEDPGYRRYFIYLNLFMMMMLMLVMANNLGLLFVGWEGVGLCSYLLIGFWFEKHSASEAGKKAFIVNRIGDFGFLLGMLLIYREFGSLNFNVIEANMGEHVASQIILGIALLLFCGAAGKSAQFPLHVWLPDAMEGPTPVSALIHAATMVTAGVYMVSRMGFLYEQSPYALMIVTGIGLFTAFFAATMAVVNKDFKRVLAYSTISQLGYMFAACGAGAYVAAIFHLITHAFFKALLFMGSGSVMHALGGELNIEKMGGVKEKMKWTALTFVIASLAISGIIPFAGFWSKDAILAAVWHKYGPVIWIIGIVTAILTAFYIFRLVFEVFYSERRVEEKTWDHAHESPPAMIRPMMILALFSIIIGFVGLPFKRFNLIERALATVLPVAHGTEVSVANEIILMIIVLAGALFSIYLAFTFYMKKRNYLDTLLASFKKIHHVLINKYFVDEIYHKIIIAPLWYVSDKFLYKIIDVFMIDGSVDGIAHISRGTGKYLRKIQSGNTRSYAFAIVIGMLLIFIYYFWKIHKG